MYHQKTQFLLYWQNSSMDPTKPNDTSDLAAKGALFNNHQASDLPSVWNNDMGVIIGVHGLGIYAAGYKVIGAAAAIAGGYMWYRFYVPTSNKHNDLTDEKPK